MSRAEGHYLCHSFEALAFCLIPVTIRYLTVCLCARFRKKTRGWWKIFAEGSCNHLPTHRVMGILMLGFCLYEFGVLPSSNVRCQVWRRKAKPKHRLGFMALTKRTALLLFLSEKTVKPLYIYRPLLMLGLCWYEFEYSLLAMLGDTCASSGWLQRDPSCLHSTEKCVDGWGHVPLIGQALFSNPFA